MTRQKLFAVFAGFILTVGFVPISPADLHAKEAATQSTDKKGQSKKKKDGASPDKARPVMWQEPGNIERRDLFYGAGGREGAPEPNARYTYLRDSKGGTQKKIIVKDERGREWTVKFGLEGRPETTASRIVWAVGYHTDQDYFVRQARIIGKETLDARDVRF